MSRLSLSLLPAPGVGLEYSVDIVDIMSDRSVKEVRGSLGTVGARASNYYTVGEKTGKKRDSPRMASEEPLMLEVSIGLPLG